MDRSKILFCILGLAIVTASVSLLRGCDTYGKVSDGAYQYSKSILSAAGHKSEERIAKIREQLNGQGADGLGISESELRWLNQMLDQAEEGNWEYAANQARTMMKEQAKR